MPPARRATCCRRLAAAFHRKYPRPPSDIVLRRQSARCRWHITARASTLLRTRTAAASRSARPNTSRCAARPRPGNTPSAPATAAAQRIQQASPSCRLRLAPNHRCRRTRCCQRAARARAARCSRSPARSTCSTVNTQLQSLALCNYRPRVAVTRARTKSCCSCRLHCSTWTGA
jgi:hypothetical protein